MKKLILISGLSLLLLTTPALAKENNQPNNNGRHFAINVTANGDIDDPAPSTTPDPSASPNPSQTPNPSCNPEDDFRNHGAFVSCIARTNIGKHENHENEEENENASPSASPTTSPTPSTSPTASPSSSPSASGSASPSPSASTSANLSPGTHTGIQNLITILQGIIKSLQNLL